uniref:Na_H_Exchanger domain-containing protein n=1 Tax=Rhabditophanes sp. KR3021 TaxID=114890 RepID=A0AC35U6P0_9BILA
MNRYSSSAKNGFHNIMNNREFNLLLTSIVIFIALYVALVGFFHRSIIHPLNEPELMQEIDHLLLNETTTSGNVPESYILTIISLFFLWAFAIIASKLCNMLWLPALIGCLGIGILFRNIDFLNGLLQIDAYWAETIRYLAFILILVRCGIGLDSIALRTHWLLCGTIGIFTTLIEVAAVTCASYFIFHIPFALSIILGFTLAAASPAITVPTMIKLQENGRGTENGVPTIVLVSTSVDNLFCITAINLAVSIVFRRTDSLSYTLMRTPVEIAIGALVGIILGLLLRNLPKSNHNLLHFIRTILITTVSLALVFGCRSIYCEIAGPLSVLLMCIVVSMRWKVDNTEMTRVEENAFAHAWKLFFEPLLFALIGFEFILVDLNWDMVLIGLAVIVLGVVARIISVFIFSIFSHFTLAEKAFASFCFLPKATVQAALAPVIHQFLLTDLEWSTHSAFFLSTCVIAIIVTAPIGQLIMRIFGRLLLSKFRINPYRDSPQSKSFEPNHFMNEINAGIGDSMATIKKDVANALNGNPYKNVIQPTAFKMGRPNFQADGSTSEQMVGNFPEINNASYQEFRERRLAELRGKNEIRTDTLNESTKQTKF